MTKKKTAFRGFLLSLIALLGCVAMFAGATFAWFTSTATNSGNKITAGTLKVKLFKIEEDGAEQDISNDAAPVFDYDRWEPGFTDAVVLKIENGGSLSFRYRMDVIPTNVYAPNGVDIADVIEVWSTDPSENAIAYPTDMTGYTYRGTLTAMMMETDGAVHGELAAEKAMYQGLILKMSESAGNEYQGAMAEFDIHVRATQTTMEGDYDADAEYPAIETENVRADATEPTVITAGEVSVTIPVGADAGFYKLGVFNKVETENSLSFDIKLLNDDVKVSGEEITVTIQAATMKDLTGVYHNGNPVSDFTYDPVTGIVTFVTTSFSPFEVRYASDVTDANGNIVCGTFLTNPAEIDPSLAEADSKYIAVNYTVNGETRYVVSERATTKIVALNGYDATGLNYDVTAIASDKLYSVFQGLPNNSTVYILPGAYESGTVISVSSTCDIIGLGNKEDIVLKKLASHSITTSKPSNRHLLNCTGTQADYIQVTIRNLTLDAMEHNTYQGTFLGRPTTKNDDNYAVQCIRKTKVKCYDLVVNDNTYGFCVNAGNSVERVDENGNKTAEYNNAYMYVENCVTTGNAVLEKSSAKSPNSTQFYFYYNGLLRGNNATAYTTNGTYTSNGNSGVIKNASMAADDWDWVN